MAIIFCGGGQQLFILRKKRNGQNASKNTLRILIVSLPSPA
jgi:hypothetical protein